MIVQRTIKVDYDIRYLKIGFPYHRIHEENFEDSEYEERFLQTIKDITIRWDCGLSNDKSFNKYCFNKDVVWMIINIDTGVIENWERNVPGEFFVKVCDEGLYQFCDDKGNIVHEFMDYVPDFLGISDSSYGDYIAFQIDEEGTILHWDFAKDQIKELFI